MKSEFEKDTFKPHPLLWNGHLQTLVPSYMKRPFPFDWARVRETTITLYDNSQVVSRYLVRDKSAPTLLILHGMGGSSRSRYVLGLIEKTGYLGWNVFSPSMYDVSTSGKKPTVFHSGCSALISDLLYKAREGLGLNMFLLSGFSMGGNILLKMIGEWGSSHPEWVRGAAVISPLTDLPGSARVMERPSTLIYRKGFIRKLHNSMLRDAVRYQHYLDTSKVLKARTIREFDEAFTVPLSGFSSADEYYRTQSAWNLLSSIRIPTYIVHSRDDPILTCRALESEAVKGNEQITLCLTGKGGHVGFFAAPGRPDRYWAEARILDFLADLVNPRAGRFHQ